MCCVQEATIGRVQQQLHASRAVHSVASRDHTIIISSGGPGLKSVIKTHGDNVCGWLRTPSTYNDIPPDFDVDRITDEEEQHMSF